MLFLFLGLVLLLLSFALGGFLGAPWVPTRKFDVEAILDEVNLTRGQLFIELGCGDGRLVAAAAKRGARAIGYEINPLLWLLAVLRTARYYPGARIKLANFWPKSLAEADVVMAFLMPKFMPKLAAKAKREMKTGAKLISYIFQLPGKKAANKKTDHWFIYTY